MCNYVSIRLDDAQISGLSLLEVTLAAVALSVKTLAACRCQKIIQIDVPRRCELKSATSIRPIENRDDVLDVGGIK